MSDDVRTFEFTPEEVTRILTSEALTRLGLQESETGAVKIAIDTSTQKPLLFVVTMRGVK